MHRDFKELNVAIKKEMELMEARLEAKFEATLEARLKEERRILHEKQPTE